MTTRTTRGFDHYTTKPNNSTIFYSDLEWNKTFWESKLNILAQSSGQLLCYANNKRGESNHSINFLVTDIGNEDQFGVWGPENPIEGDDVRLHCGGVVSNFSSDISWFRTELYDKKEHTITDDTVLNTSTQLSYRSTILMKSINKKYNGVYGCTAKKLDGLTQIKSINFNVKDLQAPFFIDTNMNETNWYNDSRTTIQWKCLVGGTPQPVITWYKDDVLLSKETIQGSSNESRFEWSDGNQSLTIKFLDETDDGTYKCSVKNKIDVLEKLVKLTVKGSVPTYAWRVRVENYFEKTTLSTPNRDSNLTLPIIGSLVVYCENSALDHEATKAAHVELKTCLVRDLVQDSLAKLRKEMTVAGLIHFEEGAMDNMNPELPLDEQAELLPYDKKWEFPRDKLKLGKQLGAGAFGVVMKAEAWGIVEGETVSTVAVKMVKKNADYTYLKALASELKIMVHLGKHLNVVNLLGASTKNLAKKELLVIVEFCRYGNLHNYLIRHRDHFIDQIDMKTGQIDPSIGSDILARAAALSAKTKGEENHFGKTTFSKPDQDSNLDLPVIGSIVYCESSTLDHASIEASSIAATDDPGLNLAPSGFELSIRPVPMLGTLHTATCLKTRTRLLCYSHPSVSKQGWGKLNDYKRKSTNCGDGNITNLYAIRLKYAALSFYNNSGENSSGEDYKSTSGYLEPRSPGIVPSSPGLNSDMTYISMTPTGEDSMMLSNNSSQPEWRSNVRGDYKPSHVRPICTRDLLCWAFQVARGMEYLVGRKVLHGDLAARNILLADDNIVKICDFGLAKSMYKSDNYKKKGDGPLPVKWMAVESIRDRIFSTQSDVWSFGIVLWEFFSLARTPYPGMEADEKLYNKLVDGYRMECPDYATKEIYKIMVECWKAHPTHRPTFTKLSEMLGDMMEENVRNLEGHSDYLSMMSAPTYGNLVSPSYEGHEHHYVNNPGEANRMAQEAADENPGYLCMKSPHPLGNDSVIFSPRTGTISGNIFQFGTPPGQKKMRNMETQGNCQLPQGWRQCRQGFEINSYPCGKYSNSDGTRAFLPLHADRVPPWQRPEALPEGTHVWKSQLILLMEVFPRQGGFPAFPSEGNRFLNCRLCALTCVAFSEDTTMKGASPELKPMLRNGSESDVESPSQINNLNNLNQGTTVRNDAEPMKEMKITNDLKLGQTIPGQTPSFLNPNYQSTIPVKPSPDNYINMPQHSITKTTPSPQEGTHSTKAQDIRATAHADKVRVDISMEQVTCLDNTQSSRGTHSTKA
ncbi:unnamed protein product [Timema podura]|uniref:Vascular endothelial growth factor receptor 1 n=1 Tax=Timema podura TaxID=61482 RepID=A0ABN7NFA1_TIMPD|nr:unnamed protein product [Timema podura]